MAIAFDSSAHNTGLGVEGHLSHTSSGADRMLLAYVVGASAGAFVTVNCDGVAMTKIGNTGGVSGFAMAAFYIVGQSSGINDIQFNWAVDTGFYFSMFSLSYSGADGLDGGGNGTGPGAGTETISVTTSLANSWIAGAIFSGGGGFSTPTGYANRVAEFSNLSGFQAKADDTDGTVTPGAHSINWTWGGASAGGAIGIGIAAAPSSSNGLFMVSD